MFWSSSASSLVDPRARSKRLLSQLFLECVGDSLLFNLIYLLICPWSPIIILSPMNGVIISHPNISSWGFNNAHSLDDGEIPWISIHRHSDPALSPGRAGSWRWSRRFKVGVGDRDALRMWSLWISFRDCLPGLPSDYHDYDEYMENH